MIDNFGYCIECENPCTPDYERSCPFCGEGMYCSQDCLDIHLARYPSHRDPENERKLEL